MSVSRYIGIGVGLPGQAVCILNLVLINNNYVERKMYNGYGVLVTKNKTLKTKL